MKIFAMFMLCATVVGVSHAQYAAAQATASISGTVVDAVSGLPVKGARVWARTFQAQSNGRHFVAATSNNDGRFILDGLVEGRYTVSASRDDYVSQRRNGAGSKLLTVAPDQHIDDLTLQLTPGAIISGRVKNSAAKPLANVSVEIVRYFYEAGQKQLHGVRPPTKTDDAGEYKISGVAPGHYYLRAAGAVEAGHSKDSTKTMYAPAYYPNSSSLTRAVELAVHPGEDVSGIDLTLAAARPVTVSGRILNSGSLMPAAKVDLNLVDTQGGSDAPRQSTSDSKGNFEIQDVLPGNYVLLAQADLQGKQSAVLYGSKPLHVGNTNVHGAQVVISPGAEVSGHITVDDKDDKQKIDLKKISVDLQAEGSSSVTALMPGIDSAQVNADGSFFIHDVPEGTYDVNIFPLPAGYYLKSSGAADIFDSGVVVSTGQPLPALDFVLSSKVAKLEGDVSNSEGPEPGASVILVPEGVRRSQAHEYRQSTTDQSGRFSMKNIVPGDYKVFAFEEIDRSAYLNPEFLQPFEDRGETVHLAENGAANLRLEVIPASETAP